MEFLLIYFLRTDNNRQSKFILINENCDFFLKKNINPSKTNLFEIPVPEISHSLGILLHLMIAQLCIHIVKVKFFCQQKPDIKTDDMYAIQRLYGSKP